MLRFPDNCTECIWWCMALVVVVQEGPCQQLHHILYSDQTWPHPQCAIIMRPSHPPSPSHHVIISSGEQSGRNEFPLCKSLCLWEWVLAGNMDDETRTSFCHTADFPSPSSCFINTLEFQITNQSLVGLGVAAGESLQNGRERIRREDSEGCDLSWTYWGSPLMTSCLQSVLMNCSV